MMKSGDKLSNGYTIIALTNTTVLATLHKSYGVFMRLSDGTIHTDPSATSNDENQILRAFISLSLSKTSIK